MADSGGKCFPLVTCCETGRWRGLTGLVELLGCGGAFSVPTHQMNLAQLVDVLIVVLLLGTWTYATYQIAHSAGRASMADDLRQTLPSKKTDD